MTFKPKRRFIWFGVNLVGIAVYLWVSSALWVQPGEQGTPGGPGDAFYWLFCIVPVFAAFAIFNFISLLRILFRKSYPFRPWAILIWASVVGLWFGASSYSHHRTMRYIEKQYADAPNPSFNSDPTVGYCQHALNLRLTVGPFNSYR